MPISGPCSGCVLAASPSNNLHQIHVPIPSSSAKSEEGEKFDPDTIELSSLTSLVGDHFDAIINCTFSWISVFFFFFSYSALIGCGQGRAAAHPPPGSEVNVAPTPLLASTPHSDGGSVVNEWPPLLKSVNEL